MTPDYERAARAAGYRQNSAGRWEDPTAGEDGVSDPKILCEIGELTIPDPTDKSVAEYLDVLITEDLTANDESLISHTSSVMENGMFWLYLESGARFRVEIHKEA